MQIEQELIDRLVAAQAEHEAARRAVADRIVELSPFNKGDVVRDVDTGALYRIDGGSSGYLSSGNRPRIHLVCTRVYKTKRRPARQTTYLTWPSSNIEPYDGEWTK